VSSRRVLASGYTRGTTSTSWAADDATTLPICRVLLNSMR